jgi:hypothetical protein
MKVKNLLAIAVAAAFGLPFAAQASADSDRMILALASGASSVGTGPTGGPASPQSAGEPKAPTAGERPMSSATGAAAGSTTRASEFSALDKNNDGMISRSEWDAHYKSGSAATGGATTAPSGAVGTPPGQTGATAGPGSASPRTAPSSDTATSPGTSGQGKPQ